MAPLKSARLRASLHLLRVSPIRELKQQQLELWSKDKTGARFRNAGAIKLLAETQGKHLMFATNAGIFDRTFTPLGLHVEKGSQLRPLNTEDGQGNFYLKPNGVFYVSGQNAFILSTEAFSPQTKIDYATQSSPLLVEQGGINKAFDPNSKNRLIRSGVAVPEQSQVIFAISNEPVSFFEFAEFFKTELNCNSALYLDGVISTMYAADLGRQELTGDFAAMFLVLEKTAIKECKQTQCR